MTYKSIFSSTFSDPFQSPQHCDISNMDHDVSLEQSLQFQPAPSKKARSCEERTENAQSTQVQSSTLELTEGVDTLQFQCPCFTSLDSFLKQHPVQPKKILASNRKLLIIVHQSMVKKCQGNGSVIRQI